MTNHRFTHFTHRAVVLVGALGALAVMTVLSVGMGWVITVVPRVYTFYASTALFAVMGIKLLREGLRMSPDEENEELEEVTQVWWRERGLFRGFVCFFVPPSDLLMGFFCRFGVWVVIFPSFLFIHFLFRSWRRPHRYGAGVCFAFRVV